MMENISLKLWIILNNFVGSRERVVFRQKNQNILHKPLYDTIFLKASGSKAEGLDIPGSDVDTMSIDKKIKVIPPHFEDESKFDLIMDTTNTKPGFTKLRLATGQYKNIDKLGPFKNEVIEINGRFYLSSLFYRDKLVEQLKMLHPDTHPHGPCGTYLEHGIIENDMMHCFSCDTWPDVAQEWIHRHRSFNWPTRDLVADVVSEGCLLVPTGNPLSRDRHLEWRISFSLAEKKIIHSMNHTQILCYGLLKLFLKHVIESRENCKELLCSYYLKTVLFYCIEEENIEWEKHHFFPCVMVCLRRLLYWVRKGHCPSYFIKTNNLFEYKIVGEKQKQLEEHLFNLYEKGLDSLMQIPILFKEYSYVMSQNNLTRIQSQDTIADELQLDIEIYQVAGIHIPSDIEEILINIAKTRSEIHLSETGLIHQILLLRKIFFYRIQLVQHRYKRISSAQISNKTMYTQLRLLSNDIICHCTQYDICTGWIQYATLCFLTGKYNDVVSTIEYIFAKCGKSRSFIFYKGPMHYTYNPKEYSKHMCGKGFTVQHKQKLALLMTYPVLIHCEFYPEEIKVEIKQHQHGNEPITCVPPRVYCFVMLFLVYNQTGQIELRDKTLEKLCTEVEDGDFFTELERPLVLALVQKCLDLAAY